ncbi:anti-sigma factor [Bacteroidia bacterium]|nr:anti-sigma factor [Bacteroidia bacterium]
MEKKNSYYIDDLIAGYLSQDLSEEGLKELETWINESSENKRHLQHIREIWFSAGSLSGKENFDRNKAYHRFLIRTGKINETSHRKIPLRILWQSAAAVALLVIVSYVSFRQGNEQLKSRFTDIVVEAPLGSRTKTYLPDGTLVWLNAGSRISYSQGFGVDNRNVDLSGEGYFEVNKNEKLPFSVKTDEIHVNVLGTKFNFRNYPNDEEATVSLLEGKVLVKNHIKEGENIKMEPNQEVFLDKKNGSMRIIKVNARNTTEWTNGYLFFDEELLPDIVKELERSYDVKIIITHPDMEKLRFYGNFTRKEQSIEEVLDMLGSTGKIKYSVNGKEIRISSK